MHIHLSHFAIKNLNLNVFKKKKKKRFDKDKYKPIQNDVAIKDEDKKQEE